MSASSSATLFLDNLAYQYGYTGEMPKTPEQLIDIIMNDVMFSSSAGIGDEDDKKAAEVWCYKILPPAPSQNLPDAPKPNQGASSAALPLEEIEIPDDNVLTLGDENDLN